jgi:hypothetical protein
MTYLDTPPVDYPRYRRSTLDRVADALGSRDFLLVYMGIVGGALLTVGCAFLWSVGL